MFIGLGGNLGDRAAYLHAALDRLRQLPGTVVVRVSRVRETAPWGRTDQPEFLNAVAELRTSLEPEVLLRELKRVEREVGRTASVRWGPREIDLDLLIYGERRVRTPDLEVPHPRLLERPFVTGPLEEIAPEVLRWVEEGAAHAALPIRSTGPDRQ